MMVKPIKTRIFREGEDLFAFVTHYFKKIKEGSIVVVTSKIVALSEGRTVIIKDEKDKERIIKAESEWAVPTKYVWLTVKDGMVLANAGVDSSNAQDKLILLPKDCFKTALDLLKKLRKKYHVKKIGVLITDSRIAPLRAGVTAVAMGYAGFLALRDYRGKPDIFGREFVYSRVNVADSLATAAVVVMGEGREQQPLAVIEGAPVQFSEKTDKKELKINLEDDLYRPFFEALPKR